MPEHLAERDRELESRVSAFRQRLDVLYEKFWVRKDPIPLDNQHFLLRATSPYTLQWYAVKFYLIAEMIEEFAQTSDPDLLQKIENVLQEYETLDHNKAMEEKYRNG